MGWAEPGSCEGKIPFWVQEPESQPTAATPVTKKAKMRPIASQLRLPLQTLCSFRQIHSLPGTVQPPMLLSQPYRREVNAPTSLWIRVSG